MSSKYTLLWQYVQHKHWSIVPYVGHDQHTIGFIPKPMRLTGIQRCRAKKMLALLLQEQKKNIGTGIERRIKLVRDEEVKDYV